MFTAADSKCDNKVQRTTAILIAWKTKFSKSVQRYALGVTIITHNNDSFKRNIDSISRICPKIIGENGLVG